MTAAMTPSALKQSLADGILAFPVTDFNDTGELDLESYRGRLVWMLGFDSTAVFPAGGAGEFFSLSFADREKVLAVAVDVFHGHRPVCAPAGQGTRQAILDVRMAERLGADGILVFPPYMVETSQRGLLRHIESICQATSLGVIVYNRGNCRLHVETLLELADRCSNLIGLKDGLGDFEMLFKMKSVLADRMLIINGMPTAEVYAEAFRGLGCRTYSSALLNFLPELSIDFHRAIVEEDPSYVQEVTREFLTPYVALRNQEHGYAVSIVKAGADVIGRSAGPVRPPLAPLTSAQMEILGSLVAQAQAIPPRTVKRSPSVCDAASELAPAKAVREVV